MIDLMASLADPREWDRDLVNFLTSLLLRDDQKFIPSRSPGFIGNMMFLVVVGFPIWGYSLVKLLSIFMDEDKAVYVPLTILGIIVAGFLLAVLIKGGLLILYTPIPGW
jgi:hypothetical protein